MRVAIIGARRVQQGLGPFLARFVVEAGGELAAVVGTSAETARAAASAIERDVGARPVPVHEVRALVALDPQALVIASPHGTHDAWLDVACNHGMHVLCEKPLVWGTADDGARGRHWARAFEAADRVLRVNAQWPWTLETFRALHPDAPEVPRQFSMQMPPRARGLPMIVDSLSHPLSMLGRFDPDPGARLEDLAFHEGGPEAARWRMTFRYRTAAHDIACEVVLDATPDETRATTYALDGHRATRTVEPASYAMTLSDGDRRIPLPDPTPRLVGSFLEAAARNRSAGVDPAADPGVRHLVEIVAAARRQFPAEQP